MRSFIKAKQSNQRKTRSPPPAANKKQNNPVWQLFLRWHKRLVFKSCFSSFACSVLPIIDIRDSGKGRWGNYSLLPIFFCPCFFLHPIFKKNHFLFCIIWEHSRSPSDFAGAILGEQCYLSFRTNPPFWSPHTGFSHLRDACNGPSTVMARILCVLTPCTLLPLSCEAMKRGFSVTAPSTVPGGWRLGDTCLVPVSWPLWCLNDLPCFLFRAALACTKDTEYSLIWSVIWGLLVLQVNFLCMPIGINNL